MRKPRAQLRGCSDFWDKQRIYLLRYPNRVGRLVKSGGTTSLSVQTCSSTKGKFDSRLIALAKVDSRSFHSLLFKIHIPISIPYQCKRALLYFNYAFSKIPPHNDALRPDPHIPSADSSLWASLSPSSLSTLSLTTIVSFHLLPASASLPIFINSVFSNNFFSPPLISRSTAAALRSATPILSTRRWITF